MKYIILSLITALTIFSCSTDVELNANYKDTTIIFGLLDQNEDLHFIRVNKTFLGQGNVFDMAAVRDSSEYDINKLDVKLEEYNGNNLVRTFNLRDTVLTTKDSDGSFYAPEHTVYVFNATDLNDNYSYKIIAEVTQDDGSTKVADAETELVRSFFISTPQPNAPAPLPSVRVSFAAGSPGNIIYTSPTVKWGAALYGKRYETTLRIHYNEHIGATVTPRYIDYSLGNTEAESSDGTGTLSKSINGESFYEFIQTTIENSSELNDPAVEKRVFKGIDYMVTAGGEELNTYMKLNEPVTGIAQERPTYTNVNNGIGLFSAKSTTITSNKWLESTSMYELTNGIYTQSLNFCTDSVIYVPVFSGACMCN